MPIAEIFAICLCNNWKTEKTDTQGHTDNMKMLTLCLPMWWVLIRLSARFHLIF